MFDVDVDVAGSVPMTLTDFLTRVIDEGILAAKESYKEGDLKREGAIAGFEACRGAKTPQEIAQLLHDAEREKQRAVREDRDRYWWHVTFCAEVDWVANCLSAVLNNQGLPVIVTPTMRGFMKAASIVGIAGSVSA